MTGFNTDRVRVPHYARAVTILTQLASLLFREAEKRPLDSQAGQTLFDHWYALRSLAGRIDLAHSLTLMAADRALIRLAVGVLHDIAHDGALAEVPEIVACKCEIAERARALACVIDEYEREVKGAKDAA